MTTNKTQLIKNCIKGHNKAQNAFYELYKSKMMGICLRYAKNKEDAEDIFQESIIRIFKNLKYLKNAEALESWIRQTVIRTSINFYHRNIKDKYHQDIETLNLQNENYQKIISGISNQELIHCINALPDGYRMVFNLHTVDGYNHKEIAEMLGISINTSKSQLRSAKLKLKVMLDKIGIKRYERII